MVKIRIKEPTTYTEEEIGDLPFQTTVPVSKNAKCCRCGDGIEDGSMIVGVKPDFPILLFHEACLNQGELFDENGEAKE